MIVLKITIQRLSLQQIGVMSKPIESLSIFKENVYTFYIDSVTYSVKNTSGTDLYLIYINEIWLDYKCHSFLEAVEVCLKEHGFSRFNRKKIMRNINYKNFTFEDE